MCREFVVVQRFARKLLLGPVPVGQASTVEAVYSEFRSGGVHLPKDAKGWMTICWPLVSPKVNTDAD